VRAEYENISVAYKDLCVITAYITTLLSLLSLLSDQLTQNYTNLHCFRFNMDFYNYNWAAASLCAGVSGNWKHSNGFCFSRLDDETLEGGSAGVRIITHSLTHSLSHSLSSLLIAHSLLYSVIFFIRLYLSTVYCTVQYCVGD
jgi:hypothetical protein